MAKAGQRKNDTRGATSGRNNPKESVEITAGTPKKRETYEEQVRERKNPNVVAQHDKPEKSTRDHRDSSGLRIDSTGGGRSGSRSNKGSD